VLGTGWDDLVRLLDEAHYVRYDFSTATKLLEVCQELKQRYGNMTKLIAQARTASELSARLQEFKHIGPITARIFTRKVGPDLVWFPRVFAENVVTDQLCKGRWWLPRGQYSLARLRRKLSRVPIVPMFR